MRHCELAVYFSVKEKSKDGVDTLSDNHVLLGPSVPVPANQVLVMVALPCPNPEAPKDRMVLIQNAHELQQYFLGYDVHKPRINTGFYTIFHAFQQMVPAVWALFVDPKDEVFKASYYVMQEALIRRMHSLIEDPDQKAEVGKVLTTVFDPRKPVR